MRRNIAHFEKKIAPIWPIFKNNVKKQIVFNIMHDGKTCAGLSLCDNDLVSLDEQGKLHWDWGECDLDDC